MNYISTKETAEKWGMSARTVNRLAKAGKIPNAKLVGKTWLIPENCQIHTDGRLKAQTPTSKEVNVAEETQKKQKNTDNEEHFNFPIFHLNPSLDYNEDEMLLFNAQSNFLKGNPQAAYDDLIHHFDHFKEDYLKIGAIHTIVSASILLGKYKDSNRYFSLGMEILQNSKSKYKPELSFLFFDIVSLFSPQNQEIFDVFNFKYDYHPSFANYYLYRILYLASFSSVNKISSIKTELLEANIFQANSSSNHFLAHQLDCLAIYIYTYTDNKKLCEYHIKKALDYALETGYIYQIAFIYVFASQHIDNSFAEYDSEFCMKIKKLSQQFMVTWQNTRRYQESSYPFNNLTSKEIQLVTYISAGYSNKEIASIRNTTVSAVSNRLNIVYQKLNVKNRKELQELQFIYLKKYSDTIEYKLSE